MRGNLKFLGERRIKNPNIYHALFYKDLSKGGGWLYDPSLFPSGIWEKTGIKVILLFPAQVD